MDSTLIQIVRHYERFKENSKGALENDNVAKFSAYLHQVALSESDYSETVSTENWQNFNRKTLLEMTTAYIGKMSRYVDNYCRKNLPKTALGNVEEFTYLIVLLEHQQLPKSELIKRNNHAITTGTDIVARLINKNFVVQFPNPVDKRSVMISITDHGKGAIFSSSETLNNLSMIGAGVLSNQELIQLIGMLQKLDTFHERIHDEHKNLDLAEIIADNKTLLQG